MSDQNSHVSIYVDLLCSLMGDCPHLLSARAFVEKDIAAIRRRGLAPRGLDFLTKQLPTLGKALETGLETSSLPAIEGFRLQPGPKKYPEFLSYCWARIFDADGSLLPEPDVHSIRFIRQVAYMFYKLNLPYLREQEEAVLENFRQTDMGLPESYESIANELLSTAGNAITLVFDGFDPRRIVPRHGPGAVATGERLEDKWEFKRLYDSIHQFYPYYDYFVVGRSEELVDRLSWYKSLARIPHGNARVILVPKDSRGPRLISCEPLEYQWIQQGLGRSIMRHLETHHLTAGRVNFTYQSVNQMHSLESSRTRENCTLDLKDASDRVSLELVKRLFANHDDLLRALLATRTTHTELPSGELVALKKFAPMGSALCFPVESVVFWALCVAAIQRRLRIGLHDAASRVYVYGDDLIVPSSMRECVSEALTLVGLSVNQGKSFSQGYFRESCGVDAYKGVDVTPVRVRQPFTLSKSDGKSYAAWVALANRLMSFGYPNASEHVFALVEQVHGKIPCGTFFSSYPCRVLASPELAEERNKLHFKFRANKEFQRLEFWVTSLSERKRSTDLDGWQRLLRDVVSPIEDADPSVVVVPRSTKLNRGWSSV